MLDAPASFMASDGDDEFESTSTGPRAIRIERPFLVVIESPTVSGVGRLIEIDGTLSIGRSPESDVVIPDPALSRRHVEIVRARGSCGLRDLGSRNGTIVNGMRVDTIALWPGDQIQIGATLLQFHDGAGNSELWVRRALANNIIALWEYLADSDELVFSEHADPALALPPGALGGRRVSLDGCIHADDRERLRGALAGAQGGAPLELELRLRVSPSLERWVVVRGHQGEAGRAVTGTMVDITSVKRRESTLARTALVFESFLDGVALTDRSGTIVDVNSALARSFGVTRKAACGQRLQSIVQVAEPDLWLRDAQAAMTATGRWMAELHTEQGAAFDVHAFPLRTDHGEEAGSVWVFRDVSEKQRMTAQLAFLDRLASLGTLSAGVAHEINNPLMAIVGNAEVIRDGLESGDRALVLEAVDEIIEGSQRIGAIVRDLKAFSRADVDAKPGPTDVRRAIEAALKLTGPKVRVRTAITTELAPMKLAHAVESRLVQVLVNLIMNAAQAIPEDRRQGTIAVRGKNERDGILIEVEDSGTGMSPEVMARAFEPFFTTKPMGGTGLGLSICHGLVTGMGGTISLRSTEGSGTTASVWLQAAPNQPEAAPPPAEPAPQRGRLRVLVIDDEPMILRTITRMLADHEVVNADSYTAAAERLLVRRETFDVVLCDLMMPDGTGMDLYDRLVAERPELVPAMVFMTGGAFTEQSQRFLRTTTRPYLMKPIDRTTLRRTVFAAHAPIRT